MSFESATESVHCAGTPEPLRLLISVPDDLFPLFIDTGGQDELSRHFAEVRRVGSYGVSADQWNSVMLDYRPHALMTCWGTPPIPAPAMPPLRYVAHLAGGIRSQVSRDLIERGLWVTNWGSLHAPSVAECALMLTLCTLRRVVKWQVLLHQERGWPPPSHVKEGLSLFGRRVGIHGFGQVARNLVRLLSPFECQVSAYSQGVPSELFVQHGVTEAPSLEALFANSDVLVEAESLTAASRNSVTEALLRRLPSHASFINVGRGLVVDEAALTTVAKEGQLQVGLDVYAAEPLAADSELRGLPNVVLLPHAAGPTVDRWPLIGRHAINNLLRFARGEKPADVISVEAYDRAT